MFVVEKSEIELALDALPVEEKALALDALFKDENVKKVSALVEGVLAQVTAEALEYASENPAAGKATLQAVLSIRAKLAALGVFADSGVKLTIS